MSNDVVDLILADHRQFREALRQLRSGEADRGAALADFSHLLVAHSEAEETDVYPVLRKLADVDDGEVDHGATEHLEGHRALLALLEASESGSSDWDRKLERVDEVVSHHLDEEERTLLADARETLATPQLNKIGQAFVNTRKQRLDEGCGRIEYIRNLIQQHQG